MTELKDLAGECVFKIAPIECRHPCDPDATAVMFTLDAMTYIAVEDGNDGYRSSLGRLLSFAGDAYEIGSNGVIYINEKCVIQHSTKGGEYCGECDLIIAISSETGKEFFAIGTENVDDYYPSFVWRWTPENLSENARFRASD